MVHEPYCKSSTHVYVKCAMCRQCEATIPLSCVRICMCKNTLAWAGMHCSTGDMTSFVATRNLELYTLGQPLESLQWKPECSCTSSLKREDPIPTRNISHELTPLSILPVRSAHRDAIGRRNSLFDQLNLVQPNELFIISLCNDALPLHKHPGAHDKWRRSIPGMPRLLLPPALAQST